MSRMCDLQIALKSIVQRVTDDVLTKDLPPKREHIILLQLSPLQRRLYAELIAVSRTFVVSVLHQ